MNERERVMNALEFNTIDKVPYHLDFTVPARNKMIQYLNDQNFEQNIGNHLAFTKALPLDAFQEVKPGFIRDEWGVVWNRTIDPDIGNPIPVFSQPILKGYRFPDPDDPRRFQALPAFLEKNKDKFCILKMSYYLLERTWSLRGMENVLTDMITNPEFIEDLMDHITQYNLRVISKALDIGFDGVYFGDDWGWQRGLIMGPAMWRKFIKPRMGQMYASIKNRGRKVFLHCCGKVDELFPDLIEIGLDVFNPFQPEVMDIFAIKKHYQGKLSFYGGIGIQSLLPFGTVDEVKRGVQNILDVIGKNGGYIASPSHALPKDIPCENILAMLDVLKNQS